MLLDFQKLSALFSRDQSLHVGTRKNFIHALCLFTHCWWSRSYAPESYLMFACLRSLAFYSLSTVTLQVPGGNRNKRRCTGCVAWEKKKSWERDTTSSLQRHSVESSQLVFKCWTCRMNFKLAVRTRLQESFVKPLWIARSKIDFLTK